MGLPLTADPRLFTYPPADWTPETGTDKDTLEFSLVVKCTSSTDPSKKYNNEHVLTKHMQWVPRGEQKMIDPGCAEKDILINKLRRSDTTQLLSHSSPSPAGMETTCCRPAPTCPGTRDGTLSARKARPVVPLCSKLLIPSSHQRDLQTSLLGFPFRMSTKLEVLEQCQWAVSRLESSSPAWSSLSPPTC